MLQVVHRPDTGVILASFWLELILKLTFSYSLLPPKFSGVLNVIHERHMDENLVPFSLNWAEEIMVFYSLLHSQYNLPYYSLILSLYKSSCSLGVGINPIFFHLCPYPSYDFMGGVGKD